MHPHATILEHGIIRSVGDFMRLNIVDWSRHKPYWGTEQQAIDVIACSFVNRFSYTIAQVNLYDYPERNDFPGWKHAGEHELMGRLYWNHFKYAFKGDLHFHDMPDFSGMIYHHNRNPQKWPFHGDIGKVSPTALKEALHSLWAYTLWISVIDEYTQIILEHLVPKDRTKKFVLESDPRTGDLIERLVPKDNVLQTQQLTLF